MLANVMSSLVLGVSSGLSGHMANSHSSWSGSRSLCYLELFAICVAVQLWTNRIRNRRVVVFCDNHAVVAVINKGSSACKKCMVLIGIITYTSMYYNTRYFAKYVPREGTM